MRSIVILLFANYNYNDRVKEGIGGKCSMNGEKRNTCRLLVGREEGKRPLGRPRCWWVNKIKVDLDLIEWGGVD
jgi:hypothetical protein